MTIPVRLLFASTLASVVSSGGHTRAVSPSATSTPPNRHLEYYHFVRLPWSFKAGPVCLKAALCPPEGDYTWEGYFDRLFNMGVRNFVLGGYAFDGNKIVLDPNSHQSVKNPKPHRPWSKSGFMALKKRVEAKGGQILAHLGRPTEMLCTDSKDFKEKFDKNLLLDSVTNFTEHFPVDGFRVEYEECALSNGPHPIGDIFKAIKELNMISALSFLPGYITHTSLTVQKSGLAGAADLNFLIADLFLVKEVPLFNTDSYVEEAVSETIKAGIDPDSLVLTVPTEGATIETFAASGQAYYGYSELIYDLGADPKGQAGQIVDSYGKDYFYYSQPRAISKIGLAKHYKLHGMSLYNSHSGYQDLLPWDEDSLCYALVTSL
ncbi:hypothetical protein FOZ60_001072 [Perkinsus olseni]|uniref:Chitinase n=1 Tax=Perkinsus olseni TaxID=32597 RepID=A0A7J6MUH0_PEROL|nr:hypothetical protein FOZ60_001072 [Perkinsus olseni]